MRRGAHVHLAAEAQGGGTTVGVEVEDHSLALTEEAEHRSLEGVGCEVALDEVGVAHDDTVTGRRVVRLDDALHGPALPDM